MKEDNWEHRSATMKCLTCMWFVPKRDRVHTPGAMVLGRCRKHAPTLQGWPAVYCQDWCGDHKLDEGKA